MQHPAWIAPQATASSPDNKILLIGSSLEYDACSATVYRIQTRFKQEKREPARPHQGFSDPQAILQTNLPPVPTWHGSTGNSEKPGSTNRSIPPKPGGKRPEHPPLGACCRQKPAFSRQHSA